MARKRTASAETLKPDPRYNSKLASKFINCLMWQGKKPTAQRVFYGALDQIKKRMPDADPIEVFTQAVEHVKPTVEVRSKRVGGATYQVPVEIKGDRRQSLAMRWIIGAARKRTGKSMIERLSAELLDAANNTGSTIKRREDTHKMAEANRAFSHYRF